MKYKNGYLILNKAEIELLSMVAMKKVSAQHPAMEFIAGLAEMKDEAEKYLQETRAKQNLDSKDKLRIEIIQLVIDGFDRLTRNGYEVAEASGNPIRLQ